MFLGCLGCLGVLGFWDVLGFGFLGCFGVFWDFRVFRGLGCFEFSGIWGF